MNENLLPEDEGEMEQNFSPSSLIYNPLYSSPPLIDLFPLSQLKGEEHMAQSLESRCVQLSFLPSHSHYFDPLHTLRSFIHSFFYPSMLLSVCSG